MMSPMSVLLPSTRISGKPRISKSSWASSRVRRKAKADLPPAQRKHRQDAEGRAERQPDKHGGPAELICRNRRQLHGRNGQCESESGLKCEQASHEVRRREISNEGRELRRIGDDRE